MRLLRWTLCVAGAGALLAVVGCGGPDLGSALRGGSSGSSYGSGYGSGYGYDQMPTGSRQQAAGSRTMTRGTYARIEGSFTIEKLTGNPFDIEQNDIEVTLRLADGDAVRAPAFFDGGTTWRFRYTPDRPGTIEVTGVSNKREPIEVADLSERSFVASGKPGPGFVRISSGDPSRFAFDDGSAYLPVGHNMAWGDVPAMATRAGAAGLNWGRVWMCHWSNMNLDWIMNKPVPIGELDLDVARSWDKAIEAAEKAGVRLQVVLQHHGQVSTRVNPNWSENPWNAANGGFLRTPGEFFSSAKAAALTRSKYRYILARWGYSTSVMAWELFNEVEWTDAIAEKHEDEVAAWHSSMADFLRKRDIHRHLITSSSDRKLVRVWQQMDYLQPHAYPSDPLPAALDAAAKSDKPVFVGEIGPAGDLGGDDGAFLHRALWSGVAAGAAGLPQYWAWDNVEKRDLLKVYQPALGFMRESGAASARRVTRALASVETKSFGALRLATGGAWEAATKTAFAVSAAGQVTPATPLPSFLHGDAHRAMCPQIDLSVVFPTAGTVRIRVATVARGGARLAILIDGAKVAEKSFAAADRDTNADALLEGAVPAGKHTVRLVNEGADWVRLASIEMQPYGPGLSVVGHANDRLVVLWVRHAGTEPGPVSGTVRVSNIKAGAYTVCWWDTVTGKEISRKQVAAVKGILALETPPISTDAAVFARREAGKAATEPKPPAPKVKGR